MTLKQAWQPAVSGYCANYRPEEPRRLTKPSVELGNTRFSHEEETESSTTFASAGPEPRLLRWRRFEGLPSSELIRFIRDTLLERKVIFFRDQHLTEDEQVQLGRQLGDLDAVPFGKPGLNPCILEIVHDENHPGTENGWHTDVTWMERLSLGSIAQCALVPPVGGDTLFSDSHAYILRLPDALQRHIEYLHGINDCRLFLGRGGMRCLTISSRQ